MAASSPLAGWTIAAANLDGLSLTQAFQRYVINDPEVVAQGQKLLKVENRHSSVFREGQAPGPFVDYHWPLDSTALALADRFVAQFIHFAGEPLPAPSAAILNISAVLVDRIRRLRDLLASGEVVAVGTFVQTGIEGPIGRLQWVRNEISIDVSNGDLCEGQDNRAVAKWTGLSLRVPPMAANEQQNGVASKVVESRSKAKAQIQTIEKCRIECVAWLEDMMKANPDLGKFSKKELWTQVELKWPDKVSWRAFEAARTEAINKTGALAWKEPGPKPKSLHP
jgi:hypothetical protein